MTRETAETIALKALGFLAESDDGLERMMELSGLDPATIRARATEPQFQGAVLDFLLANEVLLIDFCHDTAMDAKAVHMARYTLVGE